jgi:hypothetical protein
MTEIYKIIPDTEEMYSVSNLGNIRNNITNYVLSPWLNSKGYAQVCIQFTSRKDRISVNVHKLVGRAFIDNPENKPYINHIDGVKHNNAVTNLEWVTPLENNEHAVKMGLINSGADSYMSILTEVDVIKIIEKLKNGERNIDLAREYNVSHITIDDIRCNRTWRFIERQAIASNGPIKKLAGEHIPIIRSMFANFTDRQIAQKFGVAPATINQIRHGNTWKNY